MNKELVEGSNREPSSQSLVEGIERELACRLAAALGKDPDEVDCDLSFRELGLTSLSLVSLVDALNRDRDLELNPVVLFEYTTARALATHLADVHAPAWAAQAGPKSMGQTAARQRSGTGAPLSAMDEPIAIVGMAGRFPGASDVDALWELLRDGRDSISLIPRERWDWRAIDGDSTRAGNRTPVRWGGFIDGVDEFDPLFFNISPREAHAMDPQQRLLMGCVWKAIEESGHSPSSLSGTATGVFLGTGVSDYRLLMARSGGEIEAFTSIGLMPSAGPNRISHHLNLNGPSEPVETACSSSLVAVHRAVQSIRSGECDLAIAGGVNVLLAPDNHVSLSKAGALSPDGRCHTFSKHANGYVRSEGVAAIVLKPLGAAESDGDHIYGLIRGSAVNHGGRSSSLTAPNPRAQADLIVKALQQADVDPARIGYIEAHGTGTRLGDPVEVAGLKSAFAQLHAGRGTASQVGHCGIGSIKSNIGHLELAAGVAGIIKVLLQLKHRTLVRSLHCDELNPYLELEGSPFYVVTDTRGWPACTQESGATLPRVAGVSSFSVTGANAHVLIEEYVAPEAPRPTDVAQQAIVLSARNPARLRDYAAQLMQSLQQTQWRDADLRDIAYTLQVGRDALPERLGVLATTIAQLRQSLAAYLRGESDRSVRCQRPAERNGQAAGIADGDCERLLERWMCGATVDWASLHRGRRPRRLSLPTYPFERGRYGIRGEQPAAEAGTGPSPRFTQIPGGARTVLQGDESFLADHLVYGERVLPAVVYLDLVLAALHGKRPPALEQGALEDVVWLQRCTAGSSPLPLDITWEHLGDNRIWFEVASQADAARADRTVHAEGVVVPAQAAPPPMDLAVLQARCDGATIPANRCYEAFGRIGLAYGSRHRALERIHLGNDELLARLQLPDAAPEGPFILHPSMVDAATQVLIGFALDSDVREELDIALPFELERLDVFLPCPPALWVHARRRPSHPRGDHQTFDIELLDDHGQLCVSMRGFATRAAARSLGSSALLSSGYHLLELEWKTLSPAALKLGQSHGDARTVVVGSCPGDGVPAGLQAVALDPGMDADTIQALLRGAGEIDRLIWLLPAAPPADDYEATRVAAQGCVLQGFRLVQALLALGYDRRRLTVTAVTRQAAGLRRSETTQAAHAGVHGLIGSVANEYPHWSACSVDLPSATSLPWDDILARPHVPGNAVLGWRDGRWFRQELRRCEQPDGTALATEPGGVYLVIGGAGGIGSAWSEATLQRHRAQLIWVGRRPIDATIQATLDRLAQLGPRPRYLSADATCLEDMRLVRDVTLREFGRIDGVIYSALVLNDRTLANLSEAEFLSSYAAKADGCTRLAQVYVEQPPGFVLFFSAFSALAKTAGQSNYVAGCTFSDALAWHMAATWPCRVRTVNWGWWGEVGVAASDYHRERMNRSGVDSIRIDAAMRALDAVHASERQQHAFVRLGRPCRIDGTGLVADRPSAAASDAGAHAEAPGELLERVAGEPRADAIVTLQALLKSYCCEVLGLDSQSFLADGRSFLDTMLGEFGMDSLGATTLRNRLRHELGIELRTQLIIGEPVSRLVELMYEKLLLRRLGETSPDHEQLETFVL